MEAVTASKASTIGMGILFHCRGCTVESRLFAIECKPVFAKVCGACGNYCPPGLFCYIIFGMEASGLFAAIVSWVEFIENKLFSLKLNNKTS